MSDEVFMWRDKRVEDLSHEELVDALNQMIELNRQRSETMDKWLADLRLRRR